MSSRVVVLAGAIAFVGLVFACNGIAAFPQAFPDYCDDGAVDFDESDKDCGGPSCPARCSLDATCRVDDDCDSATCSQGKCVPPDCRDGMKNGSESDVDCGGGVCPACAEGGACAEDEDCFVDICDDGKCASVTESCNDGDTDGTESDEDCGGVCTTINYFCDVGDDCNVDGDCYPGEHCNDNFDCAENDSG